MRGKNAVPVKRDRSKPMTNLPWTSHKPKKQHRKGKYKNYKGANKRSNNKNGNEKA